MKVDLYHLHRRLHFTNLTYPIILDVLKIWSESVGWQARVFVCRESKVDLGTDAEVVGFTVYTQAAPAVYRLAEQLRQRGKIVVLGGPHFYRSHTWPEAYPYCDVIVSSINEQQWKDLLRSVAAGRIRPNQPKPVFISDQRNSFRYPNHLFEAARSQQWYRIPSVPTSVGCPYQCEFCGPYLGGDYILREMDFICNDVARIKGKILFICDATFGLNKGFTIELMRAIAPLHKKIILETSLCRLRDREVVRAMALGGVKWIMAGVETLASHLPKHGVADLLDGSREIVDSAHDCGMIIQGNFICGLDDDGPESFDQMFRYYEESKFDSAILNILTPYPNTALYHRLSVEGRIIDQDWEHYDKSHVVYEPKRMSTSQLIDGYSELGRKLFSGKRTFWESLGLLRNRGMTIESAAEVIFKIGLRLDAVWKSRTLRSDRKLRMAQGQADTHRKAPVEWRGASAQPLASEGSEDRV